MTLHVPPDAPSRAILLLNLGGPETLDDVYPFLVRLFEDPEIIRLAWRPARKAVARLIAGSRARASRQLYAKIGGGSPIRAHTDAQAAALERLLAADGRTALVKTAFTCAPPLVEDVIRNLADAGAKRLLALPLYPQYSYTTTRSALTRVAAAVTALGSELAVSEVRAWPTERRFIEAHAARIREQLAGFPEPDPKRIHLLFSAHSIPEKLVLEEGDPYRSQVEETVQAVVDLLGWTGSWSLSWQSRLGPVRWLSPSTIQEVERLGGDGVRQLLVSPIAFVSDHIETLCELDIDLARTAAVAGVTTMRRAVGLNDHPLFIQALADLATRQKGFWGS